MATEVRIFDLLLAVLLLWLAWRSLASADLFKAVVQYIVFGLLLALAWIRLGAPDVALAEAAIGAGLAGALLLDTLARLGPAGVADDPHPLRLNRRRAGVALAVIGLAALLVTVQWGLPDSMPGLSSEALSQLAISGVSNPVTATLLNYRSWDTLLEIGVLLLAVLGVWVLDAEPDLAREPPSPPLLWLVQVLLPLAVVIGAYLLWIGAYAPGGAFQGAALLASGGVLLHLTRPFALGSGLLVRAVAVTGFAVFLLVGASMLVLGGGFLQFPPEQAGVWILLIESAAMVSIALLLVVLFVGRSRVPS